MLGPARLSSSRSYLSLVFPLPALSADAVQSQGQACFSNQSQLLGAWSISCVIILQITGGSSGIGKAVAVEALNRGAAVVTLCARNEVIVYMYYSCLHQHPHTNTPKKIFNFI